MIEAYFPSPVLLVMTLLALLPFLVLVNIVSRMTAVAAGIEFFVMGIAPVACSATDLIMLASQWKIRFSSVVKFRLFPVFGCVAGSALLAVAAAVLIIIAVT